MKYHVEFDIGFKKNPYKGIYIALEGIDGSGKTTQVGKLAQYLRSKGKSVVAAREPRKKGIIGDIVQRILTGKIKMSSVALQYLFSTDRVLHHEEVIVPALRSGKVVISDRCFWSAIVYGILDRTGGKYNYKSSTFSYNVDNSLNGQNYQKVLDKEAEFLLIAHSILSMYHQFIVPDYTFYLKTSLNTAFSRIGKKDDVKEIYEDREKLKKVIEGYEWLAKKFAKEIITIDGEEKVEEVTKNIIGRIKNHE